MGKPLQGTRARDAAAAAAAAAAMMTQIRRSKLQLLLPRSRCRTRDDDGVV